MANDDWRKSLIVIFYCNERRKYAKKEINKLHEQRQQKKRLGKTTYEFVVHFNENATETMQDKLKRRMLREMERRKHQKAIKMIRKSLTSSNRYQKNVYNILWQLISLGLQYK